MKKIPTLYIRDPETKLRYVKDEVHPDCQWVIDGEGKPTYKWDGTAVLVDNDHPFHWLWKRREVKKGKIPPAEFRSASIDETTGKQTGWIPVRFDDPENRWLVEALDTVIEFEDGTYELVGPKIQGNPHQLDEHTLVAHGHDPLYPVPTSFDELAAWLHDPDADHGPTEDGFEGVVWHHPDGRMAKIKAKDFPSAGEGS